MKYSIGSSESDEFCAIKFISNVKKNHKIFDGIDGDPVFKRVILETFDSSSLSDNDKKLENIIQSIFKLS